MKYHFGHIRGHWYSGESPDLNATKISLEVGPSPPKKKKKKKKIRCKKKKKKKKNFKASTAAMAEADRMKA